MKEEIEKVLSYTFKDKNILKEALTHRSYHCNGSHHNERLEFLGDSVLGLVVAAYLYRILDTKEEGVLSKIKANLVSRRNLYTWAANLFKGIIFKAPSCISCGKLAVISVFTKPGAIAFTLIFLEASSFAALFVSPIKPAFEAL